VSTSVVGTRVGVRMLVAMMMVMTMRHQGGGEDVSGDNSGEDHGP